MSEDINRVVLVGRLVRDIELSYTQSGTALGKISIAVNRRVKKGDQWLDEASFFDCVQWGKRAESLAPYLLKGQMVCLDAHLKQDRWEQDGQKRSKVVVEVENIQLLGSKIDKPANKMHAPAPANDKFEDDIPF